MFIEILLLVVSLGIVVKAADWFLGAAERIGVRLGLSSFILGVLLVGFGTSLPELSTSIASVADGTDNVVIANIVGSNLANILIILGVSTFFLGTIKFDKNLIDLDLPLLFGVTALFGVLVSDGNLQFTDGLILAAGFVGYILYALLYKEDPAYHRGLVSQIATLVNNKDKRVPKTKVDGSERFGTSIFVLVLSIVLLALASKIAVDNLLLIVERVDVGVDQLTFFTIAIGTSLPELLVTFKALKKGQGDIILGNVIGSSIFNILMVGGAASLLSDQFIDSSLVIWSIVGLVISALMLVLSGITRRIHVWEGFLFMLIYAAIASKLI